MLLRPYLSNTGAPYQECNITDLQITVEGLTKLFTKFFYKYPTNSADTVLSMLVNHMRHHYEQPSILEHLCMIRIVVSCITIKICQILSLSY